MTSTTDADGVTRMGPEDGLPVLLLHPWWGITPAVHEWADALAGAGRRVVLPDLYGGRTAATVEEAEALHEAMDEEAVLALIGRLADELAAEGRPWAAMGFSMGAFYASGLAGRADSGPDELILFYGGQAPEGPVKRTRRVDLHIVPDDEYFTDEELAETDEGFRKAGVELRTFEYGECGHWFAERESPGFDESAYALARARVIGQLGG
ncbi:dienelactone hydrolase family protein [Streptomyces sp. NPDC001315]|uniref:dienelactone hydrolase family protein n=1 Tax=Streptomyces sp. NPDC001315 TaxID=3364562 RepID=UPI003698CD91